MCSFGFSKKASTRNFYEFAKPEVEVEVILFLSRLCKSNSLSLNITDIIAKPEVEVEVILFLSRLCKSNSLSLNITDIKSRYYYYYFFFNSLFLVKTLETSVLKYR